MPRTHYSIATFERGTPSCQRRPLGHEGLVTLALRQLNRQPAGVPAALAPLTLGERGSLAACPQSPRQDASHSRASQQTLKPVGARHEDMPNSLAVGGLRG
jgi:hypothetical protein